MSRFNKVASIFTALIIVFAALPFAASAVTTNEWSYDVVGTSATIMEYLGKASAVTIPSKIGNYTVTTIGEKAFENLDNITSVTIPSTVTTIEPYAFYDCDSIKTMTIGSGVKEIGYYAFEYCVSMTSVTIPASVKSIGFGAFSDCYSLTNISVNSSNTAYKGVNGVLFNKAGDTIIAYPAGLSGSYTIPSTVKTVNSDAFSGCKKMTSVTVPSSVTTIGNYAFFDCDGLTSFIIPDSVTRIGASSFERCDKLSDVKFGEGLTSIGGFAFSNCPALKSVSLNNGMITLGQQVFINCTALTEIYIPKSTTALGNSIFTGSKNVTVYVDSGSAAQTYCKNNSIKYLSVASSINIKRLSGATRYDTANCIANEGWTSAETVILANGTAFADSLVGVSLSKALDAPILLTSNDQTLKSSVQNEIKALNAKKIIILGGTVSINEGIENKLKSDGYTVERLSGSTRFKTAEKIAEKLVSVQKKNPSQIFITYGYNYPDSLAVGPVAGVLGAPILFINSNGVPDADTAAFIKKYPSAKVTVIGGTAVISADAEKNIKALGVVSVERVYGNNRYETCLKINQKYNNIFTGKGVSLTTGEAFPDALAGGAFAAKKSIPIILASPKSALDSIKTFINGRSSTVYVFGGVNAISNVTVYRHLAS